ncbi:hypothetical protein VE03_09409 [Pseudogymnoascus sp. 23342-1-I1]|nr:hypothetical protein VE03_09409 [Pseudogymnoascus sp. 23342-1-I1]
MASPKPLPGFPYPNPTKAYWQTPTLPMSDHRTTPNLPPSAKYVIVGSGITGATIAHKLLLAEPSASIVLLEARQASSGATGRNGGHCRPGDFLEFKNNVDTIGVEEALRVENLEETNVRAVAAFVDEHGIDCDFRARETLDVFVDPKQWDAALATLKARDEVGVPKLTDHTIWSAKETREELLIPDGVGAISYPAYILTPYKLVCALLEMSLKKGMNLQTNTAALEVKQNPESKVWTVRTDRGEIRAERVILATNAYTAALYPPLADFITPRRGQMAAVRPGSKIAGNPVLKRTVAMYTTKGYPYFQSRGDDVPGAGDLIFGVGSLGGPEDYNTFDDTTIDSYSSNYLRNAAIGIFGEETWGENGAVLQEWTGIMGATADYHPFVGEAPGQEGLWICAGFNGHGMGLAFRSAEALVGLVTGREKEVDEWLPKCYRLSRVF